jgi:hypothetical protein
VRLKKDASKTLEEEISQLSSEPVMENQRNALNLQEMVVINTLVCNIEENVGLAQHLVSTARDQIKNAT